MITLNSNKGFVRVESWQEIEDRPGFVRELDPKLHKLSAIIGRYVFKDRIRCGLTSCHTLHGKGYLVSTVDGQETKIGKDCGKTHFGVDFETLSRIFDQDLAAQENRDRLWSFSFRADEIGNAIERARKADKGADWVHRLTRPLIARRAGCPDGVVDQLLIMVKARRNTLEIAREATQNEIDREETLTGRRPASPHYIAEPVAEIAGISALYPENDLREILVLGLEQKLEAFRHVAIDSLTHHDLRSWVRWADSVDRELERASDIVEHGRSLLDPSNLQPFHKILDSRADQSLFREYLRTLSGA